MKTPVLFTIFNRKETADKVFAQIRKAAPERLYIAMDGPRETKPGEKELVESVRKHILSQIDWKCELKTLIREQNVGCKLALSSAITWFFDNEPEGIILEDDCVPESTFFEYAEKMLETYRDDERVMVVSGTNYLRTTASQPDFAYFARYFAIWGWATWRRAWQKYDIAMKDWQQQKEAEILYKYFQDVQIARRFESLFDDIYYNNNNTWDIQWVYTCLFNNALAVIPSKNQISNIQTNNGTHDAAGESPFVNMPTFPLDVENIALPTRVFPDIVLEWKLFEAIGAIRPFGKIKHALRNARNKILKA